MKSRQNTRIRSFFQNRKIRKN